MKSRGQRAETKWLRRLETALAALSDCADQVVVALDTVPSRWDRATLREVLEAVPGLAREVARAASAARRETPVSDDAQRRKAARDAAAASLRSVGDLLAGLEALARFEMAPLVEPVAIGGREERLRHVLNIGWQRAEYALNGHGEIETANQLPETEEYFPFVPLEAPRFVGLCQAAWRVLGVQGRNQDARFLEVGAGCGSKLLLAQEIFAVAHGLEYDTAYVAQAEQVRGLLYRTSEVFEGDAERFDGYDGYDVIYIYTPIRDRDREARLEARIYEALSPGSVVIAPIGLPAFFAQCPQIVPDLVVKGYAGAALEELRAEAERVGTVVPEIASDGVVVRQDVLQPALSAIRGAGFATRPDLMPDGAAAGT
ncbi:MAG: hypothetical protein ACFBRM_02555 [Pikeienuella sp.]